MVRIILFEALKLRVPIHNFNASGRNDDCFYSSLSSGLDPTSVRVQFVEEKLALGEAFLWILRAFPVSRIPTLLLIYISSHDDRRYVRVILAIECVFTENTTVEQGQVPDYISIPGNKRLLDRTGHEKALIKILMKW
jgi:hypothetical protein